MSLSTMQIVQIAEAMFYVCSSAAIVLGWLNRKGVARFLRGYVATMRENVRLENRLREVEDLSRQLKDTIAVQRETLDAYKSLVTDIERRLKLREESSVHYDALVEWVPEMLEYVVHLEQQLVRAGIVKSVRMPEVPLVLRDRFRVPQITESEAP